MDIEIAIPLESDSWNSYPGKFTFVIKDDVVQMELVEYDYHSELRARVITITKANFLKLLRFVQD